MPEIKLKPEVKAEWIAALEGGKYIQCSSSLRLKNGETTRHCCLGVLCEIYLKHNPNDASWLPQVDGRDLFVSRSSANNLSLSNEVFEWAVETTVDLVISKRDFVIEGDSLASRNDTGETFHEIADLIKKHL